MTKAYLEPSDVASLIEAAPTLRDRLIIRLLFHLGCRVSELISINVSDIDFKQGWVTIRHLKERSRFKCPHCGVRLAKADRFCGGCGRKIEKAMVEKMQVERRRRIRIDRTSLEMVEEWLNKRGAAQERLLPLTRQMVGYIVDSAAKKAGLGGKILEIEDLAEVHHVSPHRLRDAFAVHFLKTRSDLESQRALQHHLGHKSFDTTARYRKITGEETAKIYDEVFNKEDK